MPSITDSTSWKALQAHQKHIAALHLRDLFAGDAGRFARFSISFEGILLDYSKNRITEETMKLLLGLAEEARLGEWIEKMFISLAEVLDIPNE